MKSFGTAIVVFCASVLIPMQAHGADEFTYINLEDLESLGGVNRYGQLAGSVSTAEFPELGAVITPDISGETVIWNRDDNGDGINDLVVTFGTFGGKTSRALGINDVGQVVGYAEDAAIGFNTFPVLWSNGHTIPLDLRRHNGYAQAINNFGLIAGLSAWSTFYDGERIIELSDDIFGTGSNIPHDINDNGLMVGEIDGAITNFNDRGFVWDGLSLVVLDTLGGPVAVAYAINNANQIAGYAAPAAGCCRAVIWEGASITDLGTLGGTSSTARGINNLGQVIGWADTATESDQAFLYLPAPAYGLPAGMHNINDLTPAGTDIIEDGVVLDINDDGLILGPNFILVPNGYMPDAPTVRIPPAGDYMSSANDEWSADDGDPVNTVAGEFFNDFPNDLFLGGPMPLAFGRYYASGLKLSGVEGALGNNWRHNFEWSLELGVKTAKVTTDKGRLIMFRDESQIVNIDAKINCPAGNAVAVPLTAGGYFAGPVNIADGGSYDAWNASGAVTGCDMNGANCTEGWLWAYNVFAPDVPDRHVTGGGVWETPAQAFQTSAGTSFVLNSDQTVSFYVDDIGCNDNLGGISLRIRNNLQNIPRWKLTSSGSTPFQFIESGPDYVLYHPGTGLLYTFDDTGALIKIEDGNGNSHSLFYSGSLSSVSDGMGRTLNFGYSGGKLRTVSDGNRTVTFTHTVDELTSYTDAETNVTNYFYDSDGLLTHIMYPENNSPYSQVYSGGKVTSQDDAFGNTTDFTYGTATGTTTMTDPLGNARSHVHNAGGELSLSKDESGESTELASDDDGRRNEIIDKLGYTTSIEYHAGTGQPKSITYPDENTSTIVYTLRSSGGIDFYDVTEKNYPDGTGFTATHDGNGNISSITDRAGNTASFTYNANGQELVTTNPAGGLTTKSYNPDGTLDTITDNASNLTTYSYDGLRRNDLIEYADGKTRSFTFNEYDQALTVMDEMGGLSSFAYDANGNFSSTQDPEGNTTIFTYDEMDRFSSSTDPLGAVSSVTYDTLGRISSQTNRNGKTSTFAYDVTGKLISITDAKNKVWARGYNKNGWLTSVTDPLSNTAVFDYDSMGRVIQITTPLGHQVGSGYDTMGRKTSELDAIGNMTSWSYDDNGYVTGITLPGPLDVTYTRNALGLVTIVADAGNNEWKYDYDAAGRIISKTDPLGNIQTNEYDNRNRLSLVTLPDTLGTIVITHDALGNITNQDYSDGTQLGFAYDKNSRLTASTELAFSIDENGNMSETNGIAIGRDAGGRIATVTLAPGKVLTYTYDDRDDMVQITDWIGGTTSFVYDDAGRLLTTTRPNNIVTTYVYDNDNRLTGIAESNISSISLTRNAVGDITGAIRNVPLPATVSVSTDALGFDAASQVSSFSYDGLGRLTDDGIRTYTWNLATRLTAYMESANNVTFTYDGLEAVVSRSEAGVTDDYVWNYALGLPSISIVKRNGIDVRYYIHTPDGELLYAVDAADNGRHYYHYNEMGSTLFLTDEAGSVTDSYAYTPYGILLNSTGTTENPFTYIGRYGVMQEGTSGLYRMRRRVYDAPTMRFISRDPVADQANPKTVSPYVYAAGNPQRYMDPLGEDDSDNISGNRQAPQSVKTGLSINGTAAKYLGIIVDVPADRASNVINATLRINRLNRTFGNGPQTLLTTAMLDRAKNLGRLKQIGKAAGKFGDVAGLALNTYERGPKALAEHVAEKAAKKVVGDRVYGILKEGYQTNQRVTAVQNDTRTNQQSALDIYTIQLEAARTAYFVDKTISIEEYEDRFISMTRTFNQSLEAATESGIFGILQESAEGLKNMLKTFINL